MFEESEFPEAKEGERVCGNCMTAKPVEEFYKDGTDSAGNTKYRRDCKECYRVTRLTSRRVKRAPVPAPKQRTRRKRK